VEIAGRVVVAAIAAAGSGPVQRRGDVRRQVDEVERVRRRRGNGAAGDPALERRLDLSVRDGARAAAGLGAGDGRRSDTAAVADRLARNAVFGEQVDERADDDVVEEAIELIRDRDLL